MYKIHKFAWYKVNKSIKLSINLFLYYRKTLWFFSPPIMWRFEETAILDEDRGIIVRRIENRDEYRQCGYKCTMTEITEN